MSAIILAAGGSLVSIDTSSRLAILKLDVGNCSREILLRGLNNLVATLEASSDTSDLNEVSFLVDSSILGSIESHYHRLKKLVMKARRNKR
jgi:hypothetical protein